MKEIDNLLKPRNGLDEMSLWEMRDFPPQTWIRLHKLFGDGCPCEPNTNNVLAQSQRPQQAKRWARSGQETWADAGMEPSTATLLG